VDIEDFGRYTGFDVKSYIPIKDKEEYKIYIWKRFVEVLNKLNYKNKYKIMSKKIKSKVKRKSSKRKNNYLNLMVSDGDHLKLMKLKRVYSKSFIQKFGLEKIPSVDEFLTFKEKMKKSS